MALQPNAVTAQKKADQDQDPTNSKAAKLANNGTLFHLNLFSRFLKVMFLRHRNRILYYRWKNQVNFFQI